MLTPDFAVVILAAGLGTRLKSETAKALHQVGGRTLIEHGVRTALELVPPRKIFVVIGHQAERVGEVLAPYGVNSILQSEQLGTGHALLVGREQLAGAAPNLVVYHGDTPLLRAETLRGLMQAHVEQRAAASLLTVELDEATQYGRVVRDPSGEFREIVEFKSCTPEQFAIREMNAAIYCFRTGPFFAQVANLRNDNQAGEYYLTDVPALLRAAGEKVVALECGAPEEMLGINNRAELAELDAKLRGRKAGELMLAGVTIYRPETCVIDPDVEIGRDTVVGPSVALLGRTRIGSNCVVRSFSTLKDTLVEDGATVHEACWAERARIGPRASIGPYARLREGSEIGADVHIGNFVETKKTKLGRASRASHLAYLGDATVGENVNIGAGTITCNYDGVNKNPTTIEDGAFVGTNSSLVAPLRIGQGAYVAAGSVITEDVPAESLAIARGRQVVKEGWVRERKKKAREKPPGSNA
jgi:bifunctional UDP-N-acetylglucosamine pyrophosphorylase/glucosamine-1-phosphate N-acetyltransferase